MIKKSILRILIIGSFSLGTVSSANAFEDYDTVTYATQNIPVFTNGELSGCTLNFSVFKVDTIYFGGDLVQINGSVNLFLSDDRAGAPEFFYALKLGVKRPSDAVFTPPSSAFLVSDNHSNKEDFIAATAGETSGFRLFKFDAGDATIKVMKETILSEGTIRFAYTMGEGKMASIAPISLAMQQLDVKDITRSEVDTEAAKKWLTCNVDAIKAALNRDAAERASKRR
jgi:hypothetical protein